MRALALLLCLHTPAGFSAKCLVWRLTDIPNTPTDVGFRGIPDIAIEGRHVYGTSMPLSRGRPHHQETARSDLIVACRKYTADFFNSIDPYRL